MLKPPRSGVKLGLGKRGSERAFHLFPRRLTAPDHVALRKNGPDSGKFYLLQDKKAGLIDFFLPLVESKKTPPDGILATLLRQGDVN